MIESTFVFAACDPGFERLLKRDVAAREPSLRLAFSSPGYVTFKSDTPRPLDAPLDTVFARVSGLSVGRAQGAKEALERARQLAAGAGAELSWAVFPRTPGDERDEARAAVESFGAALRAGEPAWAREPAPGDVVLDVAVDAAGEAWLGAHRHARELCLTPGGQRAIVTPAEAPSRAYSKLVEALERFDLRLAPGQRVLELGSAPGGASLALLERGLHVTGVDPGAMDPRVLDSDRFQHLAIPAGALKKAELPRPLHWIVMDMNLAPRVALRYLERVVGPSRRTLLGVVLTLKLNDEAMVDEIPAYLERVRAMGLTGVRAAHLPSGGQEICVVGTTSRQAPRGSP